MVKRATLVSYQHKERCCMQHSLSELVRESCYPFYEPSYTELANGCSQEIQSF